MATQRKTSEVLEWLHRSLTQWISVLPDPQPESSPNLGFELDCLAGDGSQRTFYRVRLNPGQRLSQGRDGRAHSKSFVLLSDPGWNLSKDYAPHQAYLSKNGLPVPRFYYEDAQEGYLVMEDLGDELLQQRILLEPQSKPEWLKTAVHLLATLHQKAFPPPQDLPVASRRFDRAKYAEEMRFTAEHLVHRFLGLPPLTDEQDKEISAYCESISAIGPTVFCHRDFHCRNILVHDNQLFMIDFQDARLGSPHYDLASLIYDAYVPIEDAFRDELVKLYREKVKGSPLESEIEWGTFENDLKRIAFQRVVKAAGSFASFFTRYGKSTHIPYLIPALEFAARLQQQTKELPSGRSSWFEIDRWIKTAGDRTKRLR